MEQRIADLERALLRSRFMALAAIILSVCAALISVGMISRTEIKARAFVVVNREGDVVARLGPDRDDQPKLALSSLRNGGTVIVGALGEDLAGLSVLGKTAMIAIATDSTGSPSVSLRAAEKRTASLGIARDGDPTLLLTAGSANLSATTAGVRLREADGRLRLIPPGGGGGPETAPTPAPVRGTQ